jgi:hypothetical protein
MKLTLISISVGEMSTRRKLARFAYLPNDGRTVTWGQLLRIFPEIEQTRSRTVSIG